MILNLKRFFRAIFLGTLSGAVLAAWFSPNLIEYWFAPPVEMALNCTPAVQWGLSTYRKMLLLGGSLGFVVTLVFVVARGSKRLPSAAPSTK